MKRLVRRALWGLIMSTLLVSPGFAANTESHSIPLSPAEGQDGFEGTLDFSSGFRNCYGDVSAGFGGGGFTPSRYRYKGKPTRPVILE